MRSRFEDVLLLLVAVAIALLFRGWSNHKVAGALEDVGWAALAIAMYLPLVFVSGSLRACGWLRGWRASHQEIAQGVILRLSAPDDAAIVATRCVALCADGTTHTALGHGAFFECHYNMNFKTTGVHPPYGQHSARWYIKETADDGWVRVADDSFVYDPTSAP